MSNTFELTDKFGEKGLFKDFESKFKNSPFGQHWEKDLHPWAIEEFGSSKIIGQKNSVYVADKSFKISNREISSTQAILSSQSKPSYTFRIYAHPNGSKVLKMYNNPKNKPEKKFEVLVFIETDDGKFDFGKIVRVKFGQEVIDDLRYNFFSEYPWNDKDAIDIANDFIKNAWEISQGSSLKNEIKSEINSFDFKNLLIKAIEFEYDNKKFDDLSWFALLLRANGGFIAGKLYSWSTDAATWLRNQKIEEEKYWNGALKGKEYSPYFIPDILIEPNKKKRKKYFKTLLEKPFNKAKEFIDERTQGNNPIYILINNLSHSLIDSFEKSIDYYAEILSNLYLEGTSVTILKVLNAFLVGLWNGIMGLIAGIFEIIGIIILVLKNEFGYRISQPLKEKLENLFNLIFYESEGLYIKVYEKALTYLNEIETYFDFDSEKTKYKIAKDLGEIIPEFLEYVIPILRGKKLATSPTKAIKKGGEVVNKSEEAISKSAKEAIDSEDIQKLQQEATKSIDEKLDELDDRISDREKLPVPKSADDLYKEGYPFRKILQPSEEFVLKNFGEKGLSLFKTVEEQTKTLIENISSKNQLRKIVLVSGATSKKYLDDIITYTNYNNTKLNDFLDLKKIDRKNISMTEIKKVYEYLLDVKHIQNGLHPLLEKRIILHLKETKKGIKHYPGYIWERTGGIPGIHAEILSMNELLWRIGEKGIDLTDDIFKEIIIYNKNLANDIVMPTCADCYFLTHNVSFIEIIQKKKKL